ncbi:hypothetical protein EVJ58_g8265 [Rhodofomes roseus]|uniref:Uncharacterized protein n=1 Tax=Rhodofomes roseus TaxID=34475 RepID=A0A4Y9Y040_9APHY|nr:hypothetical protein EVJ58_g8265 [Rhodofomes roseus]
MDITNEVILAMANELKCLRQQLKEQTGGHKDENAEQMRSLQHENEKLPLELNGVRLHSPASSPEQLSSYESLRRQLNEVLRERDEELSMHAEIVRSMKSELSVLRNQYEEVKVKQDSAGNKHRSPGVSPSDTDSQETIDDGEDVLNPLTFLELQDGGKSERPSLCIYESPAGLNLWAAVRKELPDPSILDGVLHINPDSIIWHREGVKRCLLLHASRRFSLSNKDVWKSEDCTLTLEKGAARQLLCKSADKAWSYGGMYCCVGIWDISEEELRPLHPNHTLMNAIVQRTIMSGSKGGSATHVGKLIRELYRSGALSIRCYGMELVRRDAALDNALESCAIHRVDKKRGLDEEEGSSRKKQKSS